MQISRRRFPSKHRSLLTFGLASLARAVLGKVIPRGGITRMVIPYGIDGWVMDG